MRQAVDKIKREMSVRVDDIECTLNHFSNSLLKDATGTTLADP